MSTHELTLKLEKSALEEGELEVDRRRKREIERERERDRERGRLIRICIYLKRHCQKEIKTADCKPLSFSRLIPLPLSAPVVALLLCLSLLSYHLFQRAY